MSRYFSKPTKRMALHRSGGKCEADGPLYNLAEGQRCSIPLGSGVEFDHYILYANSRDSSLDNCRAVCPRCHAYKTARHDTPKAAKTVRQMDKHNGIRRDKPAMPGSRGSKFKKLMNGKVIVR